MSVATPVIIAKFVDHMSAISTETAHDPRYRAANSTATVLMNKLSATFTDEQRELLAMYDDAVAESETVMLEHAYRFGVADGIASMANKKEVMAR